MRNGFRLSIIVGRIFAIAISTFFFSVYAAANDYPATPTVTWYLGQNASCSTSEAAVLNTQIAYLQSVNPGGCPVYESGAPIWSSSEGVTNVDNGNCPIVASSGFTLLIQQHREDSNSQYRADYIGADNACHASMSDVNYPITKEFDYQCPNGWTSNYTPGWYKPTCTPPVPPPPKVNGCDRDNCMKGNPINIASGNKFQREAYYRGSGAFPLDYTIYYNSSNGVWSHTYRRVLSINPISGARIIAQLVREDGKVTIYDNASGSFVADGDENGSFSQSGTQWIYKNANDETETYDSSGRLLSIKDRAGRLQTISIDSWGLISSVTDDFGHTLQFAYDSSTHSKIVTVTDPAGGQYQHGYTGDQLTSITSPDSSVRTYVYNESANTGGANFPDALTGIVDENSLRYATFKYDTSRRAISSAHAGGADAVSVSYSSPTSVSVTNAFGSSNTYTLAIVQNAYRFSSVTGPACLGCGVDTRSMSYDANANPASATDLNGHTTTYTYDLSRNLETSRTEAYGTTVARTISTTWNSTFRIPATITEPNRTTAYTFDTNGNVLTKTVTDTATGGTRVWTYTYNTYGRVLTIDGPRTDVMDVTTYTYYSCTTGYQCGQVNTITNAAGQVTTYNTYNAHGQPLTITDPNGVVTTLVYDTRTRLTSRQVGGETTSYTYWPTGQLKRVTLPDSSFVQYTYDAAHRLTDETDGAGNKIHYTVDLMGNRTAENSYDPSSVLHQTHTRAFNTLNQLYQEINAAGTAAVTTTYGYDSQGNKTSIAAPLSRNTTNAFDELNRLNQITDPGTGVTKLQYDGNDNVTQITDPRTLNTTYQYTGFGDVKQVTSPDSGTVANTFDSGGNLKTSTDARGAVATYTYDALNRMTQVSYTDQTINYGYDAGTNGKGRLTSASDANHSMSWTYDAQGRVTGKGTVIGTITKSIGYGYSNGNLASIVTPSGQTVTYGYNTNHQITSISVNGTAVLSSVTYEPFGKIKGWTWANGSTMTRSFDSDGRITAIASGGVLSLSPITYDNASRITGITDTQVSGNSWAYGYDVLDRLSSAVQTAGSYGWTYDANGNRKTETGTNPSTYTISSTSNRITSITGALPRTYGYDAAGNTTSWSNITLTYNKRGRESSAVVGTTTTTYTYNALGQLIKKSGGINAILAYDEWGHLEGEYNSSTGALTEETVWLGDIPVATIRPNGSTACSLTICIFNVHTDQINSPLRITPANSSTLAWRWDTPPFGTVLPNQTPGGLGSFIYNLRYAGQVADSQTQMRQNWFRDYDPAIGRYAESDPIGQRGGVNTYAYVKGNPIDAVDPRGLFSLSVAVSYSLVGKEGIPPGYIGWTTGRTNVTCECEGCKNKWHLTECKGFIDVNVSILSGLPPAADAFSWAAEAQHVADIKSNAENMRLMGEAAERGLKTRTFTDKATCESTSSHTVANIVAQELADVFYDTRKKYDWSGLHSYY